MNECARRASGGRAVCVDGFIPPRAFQEFQALGILPIAADVRTREHLVYTPAPDIIHEAAGHAPILPDPAFSSYLRRIGDLGQKAFTLPEENAVFEAIHDLSEIKERRAAPPEDVARAEAELAGAIAAAPEASEATRLSRLYWWTAEYGLVGRPDDYKLYGAGLLSSLGESQSCHDPAVEKRVLDERCMDVAYDITRPQPHLFVTPTFEALHDVLDRAEACLAVPSEARGRSSGRSAAASSAAFDSRRARGRWVSLASAGPDAAWLEFDGRAGFAWDAEAPAPAETLAVVDRANVARGANLCVLTGRLVGGVEVDRASDADVARWTDGATGRHGVRFASGAAVEGRIERIVRRADGRIAFVQWRDARVGRPGAPTLQLARYPMLAAGDVVTARAGAVDRRHHPDTAFSSKRVPAPSRGDAASNGILALYERAERAHRAGAASVAAVFPAIHAALGRDHPREWLLRWNLLETLIKVGGDGRLAQALRAELEGLEVGYGHRQPIASGLRYLARDAA